MIEALLDARGIVSGLALDHRDSLRAAATRRGLPADDATLAAFKADATAALAPHVSVLLLDLELGAGAIAWLTGEPALVMPLEEQGYETVGEGRVTTLLPGFSPQRAASLGAVGCKLLLPYQPRHAESARLQERVALGAREACDAAGLGLVLEPIVYGSDGAAFAADVIESARRLAALGPHVLKVQFPAGSGDDAAACAALDRACGGVPWVLLGGGADAATFHAQVATACRHGARGFIVGRTVWDAALVADPAQRAEALAGTCTRILREATDLAAGARVGS